MIAKSSASRSRAAGRLVSRAEQRVHERRPGSTPDPAEAERLTDAFLQACSTGDLDGLVQILAPTRSSTATAAARPRALAPIRGADQIARFFLGS